MGTRANIAFIDYDKNDEKYVLYVSEQFNGDMAPDMAKGEKLIEYYNKIYLNKRNHDGKYTRLVQIINRLTNDFGYKRAVNFSHAPLEKSNGEVVIDLHTTYYDEKAKQIDYRKDIWSTWFDFSDYLYLIPICDMNGVFILDEDNDGKQRKYRLEKDYMYVLCFREFVGKVDPFYGEYVSNFGADEVPIDPKIDGSQMSDELIHKCDTDQEAPTKYVEIITQYKDDDRDCIVVRTDDNKHVIFKEMK